MSGVPPDDSEMNEVTLPPEFEPSRPDAEHVTFRSRRLPIMLNLEPWLV